MKQLFTLAIVALTFNLHAQCASPDCSSTYPVPITDINDFNNNHRGSNCLVGAGTVPTSANFNDWYYYSFDSDGGIMYVDQTVNFSSTGTDVYSYGNVQTHGVNFIGGSYWHANGDTISMSSITANNYSDAHPNIIYLSEDDGTRLFISGTEYVVGDTLFTADNPTNKVAVASCGTGALPVRIISFTKQGMLFKWKVAYDDISQSSYLTYSPDQRNWEVIVSTQQTEYSFNAFRAGFYRLRVGDKYSTVIYAQEGLEMPKNSFSYYLDGRLINIPVREIPQGVPYVKDGHIWMNL